MLLNHIVTYVTLGLIPLGIVVSIVASPNIRAVFMREFKSYFTTTYGYIVLIFFLLLTSIMFLIGLSDQLNPMGLPMEKQIINAYISPSGFFLIAIFCGPILTMRSFAEEKKIGTIEILWSSPIRTLELVLGKYFSALFVYFIAILLTISFPIFLNIYAVSTTVPSTGAVVSGIDNLRFLSQYIGLFFLATGILALGIFTSSITREPFVSMLSTMIIGFILWVLFNFSVRVDQTEMNWIQVIISNWTLYPHTVDFIYGKLYLKHIFFYLLWDSFFISLTIFSLNSYKWK